MDGMSKSSSFVKLVKPHQLRVYRGHFVRVRIYNALFRVHLTGMEAQEHKWSRGTGVAAKQTTSDRPIQLLGSGPVPRLCRRHRPGGSGGWWLFLPWQLAHTACVMAAGVGHGKGSGPLFIF
jgi:hypothetical protein